MLALSGLIALLIFIYARPLDFVSQLRSLPLLYLFFLLAVLGLLVNLSQGRVRLDSQSRFRWVFGFYFWALFTDAIKDTEKLSTAGLQLTIAISIYLIIALVVHSFGAFEAVAATILACTLWISAICVHQGLQPLQCVAFFPDDPVFSPGHPDGRPCDDWSACRMDAPQPEANYQCEHVGAFGITSVQNRVRYIGVLQDPNEAAMTVAIGIPLAFAFFQRKRTVFRFIVALCAFVLASITVVMSKSRGGQLVFLGVLSVYFLKRYRWKGLFAAAALVLPVLALGGRQESGPESSAMERVGLLEVGFQLFIHSPIVGVGMSRFNEYQYHTAHNSYLLAAAELGIPGMALWLSVLYGSFRVAYRSLGLPVVTGGDIPQIWGLALLSALTGLGVGIFFLSFNYHFVFWIYMGLTTAYASILVKHLPHFDAEVTLKDVGLLTLGGLLLLLLIFAYATIKLRNG